MISTWDCHILHCKINLWGSNDIPIQATYRATLLIFGQHHNNTITTIFLLSVLRRHTISLFKSPCPSRSNDVVNICVAAVAMAGVATVILCGDPECILRHMGL